MYFYVLGLMITVRRGDLKKKVNQHLSTRTLEYIQTLKSIVTH